MENQAIAFMLLFVKNVVYWEFAIWNLLFAYSTGNLGSLLMGKSHSREADHCALLLNFDLKFTRSFVTRFSPSSRQSTQWALNRETLNSIATFQPTELLSPEFH